MLSFIIFLSRSFSFFSEGRKGGRLVRELVSVTALARGQRGVAIT